MSLMKLSLGSFGVEDLNDRCASDELMAPAGDAAESVRPELSGAALLAVLHSMVGRECSMHVSYNMYGRS